MADGLMSWQTPGQGQTRVVLGDERWRRVILEWDQSGLSAREFCRQRGVTLKNFYRNRRRLFSSKPPEPLNTPESAEATAPLPAAPETPETPETSPPPDSADPAPGFVPVKLVAPPVAGDPPAPVLELLFPGGRVVRILGPFDAGLLRKVIHVLGGLPC
jgi:hypothetical protein